MKIRRSLALLTSVCLMALSAGPAFAAQGQITEVNPTGIGQGRITTGAPVSIEVTPGGGVVFDLDFNNGQLPAEISIHTKHGTVRPHGYNHPN